MADKVKRNAWATVGRILALLAAILVIYGAVMLVLGETFEFFSSVGNEPLLAVSRGNDAGRWLSLVIAVIVAILILLLEIDKWVLTSHAARGILYVVLFLFAPAGILVLIAGIFYIVAEFAK